MRLCICNPLISHIGKMVTGWYQEGDVKYYFKDNGAMAVSEWVENGTYYIDENGHWDMFIAPYVNPTV